MTDKGFRSQIRLVVMVLIATCAHNPPRVLAFQATTPSEQTERNQVPSLPEVEVTPPQRSSPDGTNTVPPNDRISDPTLNTTERSGIYPGLSDIQFGQSAGSFGQSSGILRNRKSLFETPAASSSVTRQQMIEKQPVDMFQALQNEVGIMMQRTASGQASPFVRGLTGQQVLILVDGIRLNNSFFRRGPNQYFNTIDPGMVDHIEVIRGQGSVLWGADAIGGVINLVTRGQDVGYGQLQSNFFSTEFSETFNTSDVSSYSRINIEGWVGSGGIFGGSSYSNFRDLDTGFDFGRQPGTNYSQYSGDIKVRYLLDYNQMLTISLQHLEQQDLPRSDRFPGFPGDLDMSNTLGKARFFDPQQRDLTYIRYEALEPVDWIDALTATASYHRQRESLLRGVPTVRTQETDVETVGINLVAVKDLDEYGKLSSGVDWYHDAVDSAFSGTARGPIIPDAAWYERIGAFFNWDVPLTDRLDATAGIRYETVETSGTPLIDGIPVDVDTNYHDWIGQVGLVYELNSNIHLVGSISEGFRAPNLDDLMANNPNVLQDGKSVPSLNLDSEHSINYEVGVKTDYDRLRTQTFVYWIDLQDNIVSIAAAPDTFASDNQDSLLQGVEFDGDYLLEDGWSLYGNFWYTYGRNNVTGSPLSRIPPTQGILGLRWRDHDLSRYFSIYTWMVRRQDRLEQVRDITDERIPSGGTPGYATLNLQLGRRFGTLQQHRLGLSLENITDKAYLVHGSGVFGTGFTARLTYALTF